MIGKKTVLSGKTVLITRASPQLGQLDTLGRLLARSGVELICHPVIELTEVIDKEPVRTALRQLQNYKCLVFVSVAGVRFFSKFAHEFVSDVDEIRSKVQVAAIGSGTANALVEHGGKAGLIPVESNSESLASLLIGQGKEPFLIIRANRGTDTLARQLSAAGKSFKELVVYDSRDIEIADTTTIQMIERGEIDWISVTSPAIARSTARLFGNVLQKTKIVSISPAVSGVVEQAGLNVAAEASRPNFDSMIKAMESAEADV